ncbi:Hypothetical predicted protein [Marmota monax]|uniref:Uncharacterized protein n=1 Tax=Marmota monax TaxID=9995 RepID=A0A5E4AH34_MARMO|nr:hypothetical protein GHT09_018771 [Marmota monax]VTJ56687.1 Hypothetical predicted protein [Marmota monax]
MAAAAAGTRLRDVGARGRPGMPSGRRRSACVRPFHEPDFAPKSQFCAAGRSHSGEGGMESHVGPLRLSRPSSKQTAVAAEALAPACTYLAF